MTTEKLYPPIIEGTIPSFYKENSGGQEKATLTIPFSMNRAVSKTSISGFQVKIKTISSGQVLINENVTLESVKNNNIYLEIRGDNLKKFTVGQSYKVQIAYIDTSNQTGHYSSIGVVKFTSEPTVEIQGLVANEITQHTYFYTGTYQNDDRNETVESYCFNLQDDTGKIVATSGEQIHNSQNDNVLTDTSIDYFDLPLDLESNRIYYLQYIITTVNGLVVSTPKYKIRQQQSVLSDIEADLKVDYNQENGYINIDLVGHKDEHGVEITSAGSFNILRGCDKDNYKTWEIVAQFNLKGELPTRHLFTDITVEQGRTYQYALQQYNQKGLTTEKNLSNKVYVDFEHSYLSDGKKQLKIKYNPKVASFKNNILETKTDTLGSQYPFIFRNGNVKYKEFSISGLISCQVDEDCLFAKIGQAEVNSDLTAENICKEREFKLEVLEWLNNGQPKIFRSPTEGNYIVRIVNVSLSPNDTLGRMLHTFTATAYEIETFSLSGLEKHNLFTVEDLSRTEMGWETQLIEDIEISSSTDDFYEVPIAYNNITSVRFEGMVPGDQIKLQFAGGEKSFQTIVIGATGNYYIEQQLNIVISKIYLNKNNTQLGSITYSYKQEQISDFEDITSITINDYVRQFSGWNDNIIDTIQAEDGEKRERILEIYYIRAYKKEIKPGNSQNLSSLDNNPYILYHYLKGENQPRYWDATDSGKDKKSTVEYKIYFNNSDNYVDIQDTGFWMKKDLGVIDSIKITNGVLLEIGYRSQIVQRNGGAI